MPYTTYLCQLGCPSECGHEIPCMVFGGSDWEKHHPKLHIGYDSEAGLIHQWRGWKGRGKCVITEPDEPDEDAPPATITVNGSSS